MKRAAIVLAALALASCSSAIKCDADGMIIVDPTATDSTSLEWQHRNMKLAGDRLDKLTGSPRAQWLTAESLEKAKGCP